MLKPKKKEDNSWNRRVEEMSPILQKMKPERLPKGKPA